MGEIKDRQFPVIHSTLCSQSLRLLVSSKYEIEGIETCHFWIQGLSDVYLITTRTKPYILRVSHRDWRSRSDLLFETEFLDFLQQRNLPIAAPLRTKDGLLLLEINAPEGKRYASLFQYAPGEVALGDFSPTQGHQLGKTLGRIHQSGLDFASSTQRQPLNLDYLLDNSLALIIPFLEHKREELNYLLNIADQIKQQLQDLPTTPPFWTICWGDPHSGNVHFTPDGKITLFDFDQCGYGWRAFDIAKFFQIALRTGMSQKVREAFLNGYEAISTLTPVEIKSLHPFTQTAHLWSWAIHLHISTRFNYCCLDDGYSNRRLCQLKRLKSPEWQLF